VTLKQHHHPTANYVRGLREWLPREFPGATFYFLPADITTQILNFGLPAPIDVQFRGNDVRTSAKLAADLTAQLRKVPGLVDLRVQQPMDYPTYQVDIDRTKAQQGGYAARDVGQSMLNSLSGSFQITPMFF
jgi:multidrug efflux pump subunit AcrB